MKSSTLFAALGESWASYRLSPDGKELSFHTAKSQIVFRGIVGMAIRPASEEEQRDDDKEIRTVECYTLTEHRVVPENSVAEGFGTTVQIGPPYLPLRLSAHWDRLRHLCGFHLAGDYLAVTLICREYTLG